MITQPPRRPSAFARPARAPKPAPTGRTRGFLGRSVTVKRPGARPLTMSMTTVVLVLAVIVIVLGAPLYNLANSLHEQHRASVELAQARAEKTELTTELNRWSDPDYISAQARERLGYVKPGETRYKVVDPGPGYLTREAKDDAGSDRPWFLALADSAAAADKAGQQQEDVTTSRRGTPAEGATEVPTKEGK
ncbi:FtsB family cell division protein [Nanchangia anserum]|uniref:Septum formation initiator family protein n=1 Tax=Nanchangia anserum TaxID=2692125 RepID=A0A8I0KS22_9ACTO|nr:septum formation initiator family protein [Nanchangia anserum]MBD3689977.1 septum formation initiator family protein [Nanchangia anserum]